MAKLPSGSVTFLFSDVEGSTRLWERDAAAMRAATACHNAILSTAIATHHGHHFKTIGDAYLAAFAAPSDAIAAAVAAQRALAAEPWVETGPLRVRMAIHRGEATPTGGDYVIAPSLNRLARLLATGSGGQVLLSDAVRRQIAGHLPTGVTVRDLGRHRLRDLLEPEQVAQLVIDGLPDHFPPLRSLERHPTNLPIQPTPLVGRETELDAVKALLGRDDARLVTLTGVGGTGKTRLALQVAAEVLEAFEDGAFFVDLAPLTEPTLVLPMVASTLGVREGGGQSLRDALVAYLADKRLLLMLDNFEHLLSAAPVVADLLGSCAHLKVLATSRASLQLRGEHAYPVPPLTLPDSQRLPPLAELVTVDAVALFVQRVTAVRSDFALTEDNARAVAAICARLDGLPLAIELAAARTRMLEPAPLLARLDRRLKLLTGGARDLPSRQQTLRATITWSYDLLTPDEQGLFRRLAVFAGGGSLEAAEVVASAAGELALDLLDGVEALIDQNLLRRVTGLANEPRFAMLETLREFGLEQLAAAGEDEVTRRAHAAWCLLLAEQAEPQLTGPEQGVWLERLEVEHDNLRAALATPVDDQGETTLRLAGALWRFWYMRGYFSEGRARLEQALAGDGAPVTMARAKALSASCVLAHAHGDYARAVALEEESLVIVRELGDQRGVAASLNNLGNLAQTQGNYARAAGLYEESLAIRRELGDQRGVAMSLDNLGTVAYAQGDVARAVELHAESLAIQRELGNQSGVADSLNNLGNVAYAQEDYAQAKELYEESLAIRRELGNQSGIAGSLYNLGNVAHAQGDYAQAVALHEESLVIERELGDQSGVAGSLNNLGNVAHAQGNYARAAGLYEESLVIGRELGDKRSLVESLEGVAALAASLARAERAARLLGAAAALRDALGTPAEAGERARNERSLADARAQLGEPALAEVLARGRSLSIEQAVAEALTVMREAANAVEAN